MPEITEAVQRLAIYARVSTEEQREGQTIDSQLSELERFARDKAWSIAGVYKDEGWSGGVMERPELDRLRDDALKGIFDAVLINDVDRLARDVAHLGVIKRDLERKGIKVIFRKLPSETSPTYNLMVNILGSFAEFERELIADRTRRGRRHKVEVRKEYLGSTSPYGYRYVCGDRFSGKAGYLDLDPFESEVVRRIFEWVDVEGLSAHKVVRRLNDLQVPPRKGARCWAKSTVLRILHCQTYAGVWHFYKHQSVEPASLENGRYRRRRKCSIRRRPRTEWIPLELPKHLRLISDERWERVQRQIERNVAFSPRNEKHKYLLKSLVQCGACGAPYVGDPCHGRFFYRCWRRCKKLRSVSEPLLGDAVKAAVREALTNPAVIVEPLRRMEDEKRAVARQRPRKAAQVSRDLRQLKSEEQRVLDAYRAGILSPQQLSEQLQLLKSRCSALEAQLGELNSEPVRAEQIEAAISDYCAEAARNLELFTDDEWRDLLRTVIAKVIFHGDHIVIRGHIPVPGLSSGGSGPEEAGGKAMIGDHAEMPGRGDGAVPFELRRLTPPRVPHPAGARVGPVHE